MKYICLGYIEDKYFGGPTAWRSSVPLERRTPPRSVWTIAAASIDHLHRYIELLLQPSNRKKRKRYEH